MAELKIQPDEIRDALANFVKSYDPGAAARDEVGERLEHRSGNQIRPIKHLTWTAVVV